MTRTPSSDRQRSCDCGCTIRDTVVRPSTAIRPAPRPHSTAVDTAARRRPVARGCRCHLCQPARGARTLDHRDARVIRDVRSFGWHLISVGQGIAGTPAFAYTVGLGHRSRHPELVMSGQPVDVMATVLNDVAHRVVVDGQRLDAGAVVEGALAWHPMVVEHVTAAAAGDLARYASWFNRRPARAVQLVWPDVRGLFPWQPGASNTADLQPEAWRAASARAGGVAIDPGWVLDTPSDHLAAACTHVVLDGESPSTVLRVSVENQDQWVLLCGRDDHVPDEYTTQHLAHAVRGTPSLRGLADLAIGEGATRRGPGDSWRRFALA